MGLSSFDAEFREVRRNHEASRSKLRSLKHTSGALTLALVLVILGFVFAVYNKTSSMYAPENFEAPLMEEVQNLAPKLEPELRTLLAETAPVYRDLVMQRFEETLPVVQRATEREFDLLVENLSRDTGDRLNRSIERLHRKHASRMEEQFPRLANARDAEALGWSWMDTIRTDLEQPLLHFHDRYVEDLGALMAALDQFRPNRFEGLSQDELMRQFAHLWLVKADRWVLLAEDGKPFGGIDHDN